MFYLLLAKFTIIGKDIEMVSLDLTTQRTMKQTNWMNVNKWTRLRGICMQKSI